MIAPEIFKAYDIRGIVGRTLTPSAVRSIGQALGTLARERNRDTIVVGRDGRLSGPELQGALSDGVRAAGVDVVDIGMVATPMTYFAAQHLDTACCVMVTGSHNPPDYNGLKMVIDATTLSGDDIQRLRARIEHGDVISGRGALRSADIARAYFDRITGDIRLARPLRIAVDCGNGVAGAFAPTLYRKLGCDRRRAVLRGRRKLSESPSRSVAAGQPAKTSNAGSRKGIAISGSRSTATATGWAS